MAELLSNGRGDGSASPKRRVAANPGGVEPLPYAKYPTNQKKKSALICNLNSGAIAEHHSPLEGVNLRLNPPRFTFNVSRFTFFTKCDKRESFPIA